MGLTALCAALVIGVVGSLLAAECQAWTPWVAERLRQLALRPLKGALRERLDEEWAAYLGDVPGYLAKVFCSLGFNLASCEIVIRSLANQVALKSLRASIWIVVEAAAKTLFTAAAIRRNKTNNTQTYAVITRVMTLSLWLSFAGYHLSILSLRFIDDPEAKADTAEALNQVLTKLRKGAAVLRNIA